MNKQKAKKTRTGQSISKHGLNKSIFNSYFVNAQVSVEYNNIVINQI